MDMNNDQLIILEIARVSLAIDQYRKEIGLTLDLSDAELARIELLIDERLNKGGYCD
jgi:hypothetical protein